MKWRTEHIQGGVLVASQTTSGGFKDVMLLTRAEDKWAKVSLLDGLCNVVGNEEEMAEWLNKHAFVPISKTVTWDRSVSQAPENRLGHNLKEPRIYAYGSYRNAEFIALRKWLMSLRAHGIAGTAAAALGKGREA